MSEQHVQAGKKGGNATLAKYGREHYRKMSRKSGGGGRPRWQDDLAKARESHERAVKEARRRER